MLLTPPTSESDLLERAQYIAGRRLSELATQLGIRVPTHMLHAKGWVGQLLELCLGATAGSKSEPDFQGLGIELKSIPIWRDRQPRESTYVCTAPLLNIQNLRWEESIVYKKL